MFDVLYGYWKMPVHVSMNTRKMKNVYVQPRLVNICAFPKAYMQRISNISSNKKNTQKIYDEMSISFFPSWYINHFCICGPAQPSAVPCQGHTSLDKIPFGSSGTSQKTSSLSRIDRFNCVNSKLFDNHSIGCKTSFSSFCMRTAPNERMEASVFFLSLY